MRHYSFKVHLHKSFNSLLCAVVLFSGLAMAHAQTKTLADGNPPLTGSMINRFVNLMQWSLDAQFTAQDHAAVQKQIIDYWQTSDEENIKGVLDMLAFEEKLANASEAQKRELQPQVKQKLLEAMEGKRAEALNALLLGVYERQQNANVDAEDSTIDGGAALAELVGKWRVLHGNSIVSVNINSGRIGDGNAMIAEYDIQPNGRVIYSFVLQQSNYGCTTRIKTSKTGRATVSGSRVTFNFDGGTTISEDGCNARYNYTKKLAPEKETLEFKLGQKDGQQQFCFDNGKFKDCAIKVK